MISHLSLIIAVVLVGLIGGYLYFIQFEQFDPKSLPEKCWTVLHYLNKKGSPLYLVHLKSILTGLILIISSIYGYTSIAIFFGSCIIGLHIAQLFNEKAIINSLENINETLISNGLD